MRAGALLLMAVLMAVLMSGCAEDQSPPAPAPTPPAKPSLWQQQNGSLVVAVPSDQEDTAMAQAIVEARATAEQARKRWHAMSEEQRLRWSIKWAAATTTGEIEHLWVQPVNWSEFRIEGLLASQPTSPLASGKSMGDLVSFPIEELSDWIYYPDPAAHTYEGGFTVKVLEERFGRP